MRRGKGVSIDRLLIFGLILLASVIAFEIYNFDSTRYSLSTFFGTAAFLGIPWATILALAFCGVDFAGVAQLFTPEKGRDEKKEIWYLFGAWFLASTINAFLTWWAVLSMMNAGEVPGNSVMSSGQVLRTIPIAIALMVWLTRLLLIGVTAVSGDHLLHRTAKVTPKARSNQPKGRTYRQNQSRNQKQSTPLDELLR